MYLVNDLLDQESDHLHFSKKNRPIASGKVSPPIALLFALILSAAALLSSFYLSIYLFYILIAYLLVQLAYSFWLKDIIIVDTLVIAFSFMLRVFAGSFVVLVSLSSWLI
jgi:4-hydroxybenzoate polyprenyltransferase